MRSSGRRPEWYETAFGRFYPFVYAHRDDASAAREATHLMNLLGLEGTDVRILDVCCGAGRHMAALAGMGLDVLGVDLSHPLLGEAAGRPEAAGRLARADMRHLPFGPAFGAVLNLFTSFGYFDDDADNERALAEMRRVLIPRGRIVLDHMNRPAVERSAGTDTQERDGAVIHQERWIEGNRVRKRIDVTTDDRGTVTVTEDVRLYEPEEMKGMFEHAGFTDVRLYGSLEGAPLTDDAERMIAVAERGCS